ncbi:hypothetical protein ABIC38_005750 [Variovorax sp. 1126]
MKGIVYSDSKRSIGFKRSAIGGRLLVQVQLALRVVSFLGRHAAGRY